MRVHSPDDEKLAPWHDRHPANPDTETVTDPAFPAGDPFCDRDDVVQVKYEMLHLVQDDQQSVSHAARAFGFSRPSFYQAEAIFAAHDLSGLLPQRAGPKRAHELTGLMVKVVQQALTADPRFGSDALILLLRDQVGLSVHPGSTERASTRHARKRLGPRP